MFISPLISYLIGGFMLGGYLFYRPATSIQQPDLQTSAMVCRSLCGKGKIQSFDAITGNCECRAPGGKSRGDSK